VFGFVYWSAIAGAAASSSAGGLSTRDYLGMVGLVVTVTALGVTIYQTMKTRGAAEATRESVRGTLGKLARDEMLGIIDDLKRIDRDLQAAIDAGHSKTIVGDRLADWRDKASGLWQLIAGDEDVRGAIRDELLQSAKQAAELKGKLPAEAAQLGRATANLRGEISRVCGELATVEQYVRYQSEEKS
jgi:hypothetical protein